MIGWIEDGLIDLFAFNDHTDDIAERLDDRQQADDLCRAHRLERRRISPPCCASVKARAAEVPASMQRIAAAARAAQRADGLA